MQEDTYKTIQESAEAIYTEKRSKFIAIALPVRTLSEVKSLLEEYQKKYYDARNGRISGPTTTESLRARPESPSSDRLTRAS